MSEKTTSVVAGDATGYTDFDFESMSEGPGGVRFNYAPGPVEHLIGCYVDREGAPHFYVFECVGTVDVPDNDHLLQRVWVPEPGSSGAIPTEVLDHIDLAHGRYADSRATAKRRFDSFTEKPQ